MIPTSKLKQVPFRGKASSSDYNEFTKSSFLDIVNLFNKAEELKQDLEWAYTTQAVGECFLSLRLTEQERKIEALRQMQAGDNKKMLLTVDQMDADTESTAPAYIYKSVNTATISSVGRPTPKLYVEDEFTKEVFIPQNINILALPQENHITIKDHTLKDMISPNIFKFWMRKMVTDQFANSVETKVIIDIPETIITNRDINCITISPYPTGAVDITSVEYRLDSDLWYTIPGFNPMFNATDAAFMFYPIAAKQIRVTLRQHYYFTENNKHIFYLGIRNIGVFNITYKNNTGSLKIPVEFEDTRQRNIVNIKPIFHNDSALSDSTSNKRSIFNYGIYEVDEAGNSYFVKDSVPIQVNSDKLLIKANLNIDSNGTAPALKAVELEYQE